MNWGRIVIGGLLIEVVLTAATVPLAIANKMDDVVALAVPGCFIAAFLVAWWLLRKVTSHHAVQGLLMAAVGTAIYLGLVLGSSGWSLTPVIELYGLFLFLLANGLRLLGGVTGGLLAQRSQR